MAASGARAASSRISSTSTPCTATATTSTGYARNLERFDRRLAALLPRLAPDDLLVITADHGNDPTTPSTDHSREHVPVLVTGERVRKGVDLGTRSIVRRSRANAGRGLRRRRAGARHELSRGHSRDRRARLAHQVSERRS